MQPEDCILGKFNVNIIDIGSTLIPKIRVGIM
jgi:hypothetical protein